VPIVQLTKGVRAHKVVCVSSWKLSLCVVYLVFACLVLSPDLGEIVSLSLLRMMMRHHHQQVRPAGFAGDADETCGGGVVGLAHRA
jgi:hypothetical protein